MFSMSNSAAATPYRSLSTERTMVAEESGCELNSKVMKLE
jgi:hypothetical protein